MANFNFLLILFEEEFELYFKQGNQLVWERYKQRFSLDKQSEIWRFGVHQSFSFSEVWQSATMKVVYCVQETSKLDIPDGHQAALECIEKMNLCDVIFKVHGNSILNRYVYWPDRNNQNLPCYVWKMKSSSFFEPHSVDAIANNEAECLDVDHLWPSPVRQNRDVSMAEDSDEFDRERSIIVKKMREAPAPRWKSN